MTSLDFSSVFEEQDKDEKDTTEEKVVTQRNDEELDFSDVFAEQELKPAAIDDEPSVDTAEGLDFSDVFADDISAATVEAAQPSAIQVDDETQQTQQPINNTDASMINAYLRSDDAFYDREYLESLDSQKLTDVLFEEDTDLVKNYYPKIVVDEGEIVSRGGDFSQPTLPQEKIEDISRGAVATARVPTWREQSQQAIASAVLKSGLTDDPRTAQSIAMNWVGNPNASSILGTIGGFDLTPMGAAFALQESIREINKLRKLEDTEASDYLMPGFVAALSVLEAVPLTKGATKAAKKLLTGKGPEVKTIEEVSVDLKNQAFKQTKLGKSFKKLTDRRRQIEQTREAFFAEKEKTFDAFRAGELSAANKAAKAAEAKKIADENQSIREDVIRQFETNNDIIISKRNKQGKLVIDRDKARIEGEKIIDETGIDASKIDDPILRQDVIDAQDSIGGFSNPRLLKLVMEDDKLDAVVATIAQVKKANPNAFKEVKKTVTDKKTGKKKTVGKKTMDVLFDEGVKGNLFSSDELRAILNEYGISLDDYIMMTLGSATRFGRGLQKFAEMKKAMGSNFAKKSQGAKNEQELADAAEGTSKWLKNTKRFENVVRGAMVSAFATAARNFESAIVRFPLEGLTNLMEEGLVRAAKAASVIPTEGSNVIARSVQRTAAGAKGFTSAINPFGKDHAFKDSFAMYGYTFGDRAKINRTAANVMTRKAIAGKGNIIEKTVEQVGDALGRVSDATPITNKYSSVDLSSNQAEFVDYILGQDEFAQLATRFYDQVNEVMKYTGRGEGGVSDAIFEPIEDLVQTLNGPNRLQEFVTRRAYFRTDLHAMVKREWGIDIEEVAQSGRISDVLNDIPDLKPEGARPFSEIVTEATEKALEKTYASSPNFAPFKAVLGVLNKIPLSTLFLLPFPRFTFKALEYAGELVAGMPIAMIRKHFPDASKYRGKANRDNELIARNISGIAALGAFKGMSMLYDLYDDRGAPGDYKKIRVPGLDEDGKPKVIDISAQYPLPQISYLSRFSEEAIKVSRERGEPTFPKTWYDGQGGFREFSKLFTGMDFRGNQTMGNLFDDLAAIAADESLVGKEAQQIEAIGKAAGDISTRIFQPYTMVVDFERAIGIRTKRVKDHGKDPFINPDGAFLRGFKSQFGKRITLDPAKEAALPDKKSPTRDDVLKRLNPEWKLATGITVMQRDTEAEDFLIEKLGIPPYTYKSRTGIKPLDRAVDTIVSGYLPILIDEQRRVYNTGEMIGENKTLLKSRAVDDISRKLSKFKGNIVKNGLYRGVGENPGYLANLLRVQRLPRKRQLRLIQELKAQNIEIDVTADPKIVTEQLGTLLELHKKFTEQGR